MAGGQGLATSMATQAEGSPKTFGVVTIGTPDLTCTSTSTQIRASVLELERAAAHVFARLSQKIDSTSSKLSLMEEQCSRVTGKIGKMDPQAQVSSRKLEFTPRQLPVSQQQLFPASLRSTGTQSIESLLQRQNDNAGITFQPSSLSQEEGNTGYACPTAPSQSKLATQQAGRLGSTQQGGSSNLLRFQTTRPLG